MGPLKELEGHYPVFWPDGMPSSCECGESPWEIMSTDNSGPDENMVLAWFYQHQMDKCGVADPLPGYHSDVSRYFS